MNDPLDPLAEALTPSPDILASANSTLAETLRLRDEFLTPTNSSLAAQALTPSADMLTPTNSSLIETIRPSADMLASTASSLVAEMLRPSADILASSVSALAADALRPNADILASMNSSLAEVLRPSADIFAPMSSALIAKAVVPYSITLETLQAQIDADKLRWNPAEWAYEALLANIRDFEAKLDNDHEIGVRLVSFQSITIHIEGISYTSPNVITFYGRTDDQEMRQVQLVQDTSQLNVLLMAVEKQQLKARRIGFIQDEEEA